MALRPWLEDTFEVQLLLGNYWLQKKNKDKSAGVNKDLDRAWEGLYRDNGSCLDITNCLDPGRNNALRVIQAQPLILTDGDCRVVAHFTKDCTLDFSKRFPGRVLVLQACIAVRKYTIRFTSYGPPHEKLHFTLHQVDWLSALPSQLQLTSLKPVDVNDRLGAVLKQLHETRAQADLRCLGSVSEEGTEETALPINQAESAAMGDSPPSTQAPHTQAAFGTQLSHPIRSRFDNDEPLFLGIKRKGPVLAGNARRKDIKPVIPSSDDTRNQLLSLLGQGQKQRKATASAGNSIPAPFEEQTSPVRQAPPEDLSRNATTEVDSTTVGVDQEAVSISLPPLAHGEIQERRGQPMSPTVLKSAKKDSRTTKATRQTQPERIQDPLIPDCPWIAGLEFSRESLQVPYDQQRILQKPESWHNPQPGVMSFPEGNVPIQILRELSRLADEKAAAEEDPETDNEEDIDPSPDSVQDPVQRETVPSPGLTVHQTQDDDIPATQVSWSVSPSPEPPQRPPRSYQELPPDSSFEHEVISGNTNDGQQENMPEQQSQKLETHKLPNQSRSTALPSSPPVVDLSADTDDEMEMETSVPQGLGEDDMELVHPEQVSDTRLNPALPKSKPLVQVKETPYARGRTIQDVVSLNSTPEPKTSSGNPAKDALSTSVVRGTLDNQTSAGFLKKSPDQPSFKVQLSPANSALLEQHHFDPRSMKRKLDDSPSKNGGRHTKRREIKLVGFGGEPSSTANRALALEQDRAKSFRKFQDKRKPSTYLERHSISPSLPVVEADVVEMDIDPPGLGISSQSLRTMSPRHASLYDEPASAKMLSGDRGARQNSPSPVKQNVHALHSHVKSRLISSAKARDQPKSSNVVQQATPMTVYQSFKAVYPEYTGGTKHFAGLCVQMYELDQEDKMVPKWQWDDFIIRNRTDYKDYVMDCVDRGENPKPYHRFYKDSIRDTLYKKGVIESRKTLLKAFEELGVERPAPESLMQPAKSPPKKKSSRASLPGAFHQHGKPAHDGQSDLQRDRLRHSLPTSSSGQVRTPGRNVPQPGNDQPQQSTSSRAAQKARATTKLNLLQRLSSDQIASPRRSPEATGDPFRDYCFAIQRSTSWTGSRKIDPTKPWPQNLAVRPSIADVPRPKVDVLKWRDVL